MSAGTLFAATGDGAGNCKFDLIHVIGFFDGGKTSPFDVIRRLLGNELILSNDTLRGYVVSGILTLNRITLEIGDLGLNATNGMYDEMFKRINASKAARRASERLRVESVGGITATTPSRLVDRKVWFRKMREQLLEHARTITSLKLTLRMPHETQVLPWFFYAIQTCRGVTELDMHVEGIVGHEACDGALVYRLEATVKGMPCLKDVTWIGQHYLPIPLTRDDGLLANLAPTIESVTLAGQRISITMDKSYARILTARFADGTLQNLVNFNLSGYVATATAATAGLHLCGVFAHESSNVQKLTLPAEWGDEFETFLEASVLTVAARGEAMLCADRPFTLVVCHPDDGEAAEQVLYLVNLLRNNNKTNVVVEVFER